MNKIHYVLHNMDELKKVVLVSRTYGWLGILASLILYTMFILDNDLFKGISCILALMIGILFLILDKVTGLRIEIRRIEKKD